MWPTVSFWILVCFCFVNDAGDIFGNSRYGMSAKVLETDVSFSVSGAAQPAS